MAQKVSFDAYLGWVNITNPNQIPADARVIGANDLLRYEKLGKDTAAKFAEVDTSLEGMRSDTVISDMIGDPKSETRYTVESMVKGGVAKFQEVIDKVPSQVQAQVPPLVTEAISKDSTLIQAATSAVGSVLDDAGVLTGTSKIIDPEVAFAVADESGRQSWVSVTAAGGVPKHTKEILGEALGGGAKAAPHNSDLTDIAYVVSDSSGRRSEIEIGADGRFTPRVIEAIASRINPASIESRYATKLACWGDSLTYSQSSSGVTLAWPETVGQILGVPVFNGGRPAHGSADIATRQGALRPLVTVEGNKIPAAVGQVTITSISPTDGWRAAGTYVLNVGPGTIAGIPGTLYHDLTIDRWYFVRSAAGMEVQVPPNTPFIGSDGVGWRDAAIVIWAGTNNSSQTSTIIRDIDSMIAWVAPYTDKYIVLPISNTNASLAMKNRYGDHFEDHRSHLIKNGMAEAGLTPTEADLKAMAENRMPPSLTYDGTHFVQGGYDVIARYIARRLKERGYFA